MSESVNSSLNEAYSNCLEDEICNWFALNWMLVDTFEKFMIYLSILLNILFIWFYTKFNIKSLWVNLKTRSANIIYPEMDVCKHLWLWKMPAVRLITLLVVKSMLKLDVAIAMPCIFMYKMVNLYFLMFNLWWLFLSSLRFPSQPSEKNKLK